MAFVAESDARRGASPESESFFELGILQDNGIRDGSLSKHSGTMFWSVVLTVSKDISSGLSTMGEGELAAKI